MSTVTGLWLIIQTPTTDGVSNKNAPIELELQINGAGIEIDTTSSTSTSDGDYNQLFYRGWATQFYWKLSNSLKSCRPI